MNKIVSITPRFRRSVRIDTDYVSAMALEDFYCPASFRVAIEFMASHIAETGQGAFTWTGPYGGGKSSLALALTCLFGAPKPLRERAEKAFGDQLTSALANAVPDFRSGWDVLPMVTERRSIADQLIELLNLPIEATPKDIIADLESRSFNRSLLLVMDELGRGLEAAANGESDLHILQDLAEIASRSQGRLIVLGILHRSFEEYAEHSGRKTQESWAKIQGRFVDISISISLAETVELIGKALGKKRASSNAIPLSESCVGTLRPDLSKAAAKHFARQLARTAPLHPLTTCLVGPLSRRRFGQNQRSVFSFLNSAEPFGLQDALTNRLFDTYFPPHLLWNYLAANFESAILSSPDGRRWALAHDVLERSIARGAGDIEQQVLKTIAIFDLLKDRSGLASNLDTLVLAMNTDERSEIKKVLLTLERHSEIVFRKHSGVYTLYAGSDFDVDERLAEILQETKVVDLGLVRSLADLQAVLAKRHHGKTGTMRWFEMCIEPVSALKCLPPPENAQEIIGRIIFPLPVDGEETEEIHASYKDAVESHKEYPILIGHHTNAAGLLELTKELQGLNSLDSRFTELRGDPVARREIDARSTEVRQKLENLLDELISECLWYQADYKPQSLTKRQLNERLSTMADKMFAKAPCIHNELLNCSTPSSSAVSARTKLMKRMIIRADDPDLGFEGTNYPAERGLYITLLKETGIHTDGEYCIPQEGNGLLPLWHTADQLLEATEHGVVTADKIIRRWSESPIGLKPGLGLVFLIAYALSQRESISTYREGIFQHGMSNLCVEFLARDPRDIGLRRVEMKGFVSDTLETLGDLLKLNGKTDPIDVARKIIVDFDALVPWTAKTQSLTPKTLQVREILKRANDPNKMLFDDLPSLTKSLPSGSFDASATAILLRDALAEMRAAYPKVMDELKNLMLKELDVRGHDEVALRDLRDRADNIQQIGGDLKLDAFVGRLTQFHGTREDMEGIASIATGKMPQDWNDGEKEHAALELAELATKFLKTETFARVKGRKDRRHALAVVVGREGTSHSLFKEFEISDHDKEKVTYLADLLDHSLSEADNQSSEIILAALAKVASKYLSVSSEHTEGRRA